MIGTSTISLTAAIINVLMFFGITTITDVKNLLMKMVGKLGDEVEMLQNGDDVEIRKNGKVVFKVDMSTVEQFFPGSKSENEVPSPESWVTDMIFDTYDDFIFNYWNHMVVPPIITCIWRPDNGHIILDIKVTNTSRLRIEIIDGDDEAYNKLTQLGSSAFQQ